VAAMGTQILVVDEHATIRETLNRLFKGTDLQVVAEAANAEDAVREALRPDVDIVLLDLMMRGDGIEVLRRIKRERPELPVLIYSSYESTTSLANAFVLRAHGYLAKGISSAELMKSIRSAAAGATSWDARQLQEITKALAPPDSLSAQGMP